MVHFFNSKTEKCTFLHQGFWVLGLLLVLSTACNRVNKPETSLVLTEEQYRSIGEQIRAERIKKGLSQQQLAEAVSISQNALSLIEDGLATPIYHKITAIQEYLQVELVFNLPPKK